MGSPKALLPLPDGRSFVAAIAATLRAAGARDLVVVTGRDHDAIAAALLQAGLEPPPRVARNPDPSRGQLSSVWVGMDAVVDARTEAVLVTLVDVPLVSSATVRQIIEAWRRSRAPIVRPAIGDRHGHPVIFDRALLPALRAASLDEGAKAVVRAHAHEVLDVPVDDEGCLADVDTRDDYRRIIGRVAPPAG